MLYKPAKKPITIEPENPKYDNIESFIGFTQQQQECMVKNLYITMHYFTKAGPQLDEWLEVIEDNWMTTEGRHCSQSIVDEFKKNIDAVKCLVRGLKSPMASHNMPFYRRPTKVN
jgi:hypothetical protein